MFGYFPYTGYWQEPEEAYDRYNRYAPTTRRAPASAYPGSWYAQPEASPEPPMRSTRRVYPHSVTDYAIPSRSRTSVEPRHSVEPVKASKAGRVGSDGGAPVAKNTVAKTTSRNPTVFKTYDPDAVVESVSKELNTIMGPKPQYVDEYAIYTLEDVSEPRVRVISRSEVHVSDAGKTILKFCLPRGLTATDVEASLKGRRLTVRVPHCLSAAQECLLIDVIDGLLGDEYDEYGYYASLCEQVQEKEQLKEKSENHSDESDEREREEEALRHQEEAQRLYEQVLEKRRQKEREEYQREQERRRQVMEQQRLAERQRLYEEELERQRLAEQRRIEEERRRRIEQQRLLEEEQMRRRKRSAYDDVFDMGSLFSSPVCRPDISRLFYF